MVHPAKEDRVVDRQHNPSPTELQWFGVGVLALAFVAGGLPWLRASLSSGRPEMPSTITAAVWLIALLFASVYYSFPGLRRHLYHGYMAAAYPIGLIVSHLILGAVFYGMISPVGLLLRCFGRDGLARKREQEAASYWSRHQTADSPGQYFRQF